MKALIRLLIVVVMAGCATNPATGRRQLILMSEQEEIQIGRQSDAEIRQQMGLYDDPQLQAYVRQVGQKLVAGSHRQHLPWTFAVVDEPAVNAFAVPGGFIYLTRGILPFLRSEAELAGVLGHEIGHVDARHSAEAYSRQLGAGLGLVLAGILVPETQPLQGLAGAGLSVLFLKYGREAELESDRLGVQYASRAGWDPRGVPGMLTTLARLDEASGSTRGIPNWALTHPPAADRVERVQEVVAQASTAKGIVNENALDRYLDGLVFGDSREKGIVRGNEFLHPVLRFAIRFPEGWQVMNTDEQVAARRDENSNHIMLLQLAQGSGPLQQVAPAQMANAGWQQLNGQQASINGLDAYVGTYQGRVNNVDVRLRAAHVRAGNQTYVVAGLAPVGEFASAEPTFTAAIRTFRSLSAAEADRIQPNRIDFRIARAGDTWESLAREQGVVSAATLAIMNGRDPSSQPKPGERLRIVVAG
ncbi:MAG: M48 family metalloprotease [Acidobacteriota bacterium]|jgi:predicted Zn-dependent protease